MSTSPRPSADELRLQPERIFVRALAGAARSIHDLPLDPYGEDNYLVAWAVRADAEQVVRRAIDEAMAQYSTQKRSEGMSAEPDRDGCPGTDEDLLPETPEQSDGEVTP